MRRWLTIRWRTTTSAPSTAASVPALSPTDHSNTMLFGAFSWSCGAPGAIAFSASTTAGSGSQSTSIDLERVERLLRCLGDDRGDPLAGPLDAVRGERPRRVDVVLDARTAAGRPGHRQRVVRDVGPDEDGHHAGHRLGGGRVDRADVGVRVGAAKDRQVGHRRQLDVVEIVAVAGDEARILDPLDRVAEDVDSHGVPPRPTRVGRRRVRHRLGGGADRDDDVLVPGAATEVALDRVADLVVGRIRVTVEQVDGGHDHARRAEAALQAVLLPEGRLHRMELVTRGEPLDRP